MGIGKPDASRSATEVHESSLTGGRYPEGHPLAWLNEESQPNLSEERRQEIIGLGFPDDGYDYLQHMRHGHSAVELPDSRQGEEAESSKQDESHGVSCSSSPQSCSIGARRKGEAYSMSHVFPGRGSSSAKYGSSVMGTKKVCMCFRHRKTCSLPLAWALQCPLVHNCLTIVIAFYRPIEFHTCAWVPGTTWRLQSNRCKPPHNPSSSRQWGQTSLPIATYIAIEVLPIGIALRDLCKVCSCGEGMSHPTHACAGRGIPACWRGYRVLSGAAKPSRQEWVSEPDCNLQSVCMWFTLLHDAHLPSSAGPLRFGR